MQTPPVHNRFWKAATTAIAVASALLLFGFAAPAIHQLSLQRRAEKLYMGLGLVLSEAAKCSNDRFPLPDIKGRRLVPRIDRALLRDLKVDVESFEKAASKFVFVGCVVRNDDDVAEVLQELGDPLAVENMRLRVGSRGDDALKLSRIPLLIERPGKGAETLAVLFADNHVEFRNYPGVFPVSERLFKNVELFEAGLQQ